MFFFSIVVYRFFFQMRATIQKPAISDEEFYATPAHLRGLERVVDPLAPDFMSSRSAPTLPLPLPLPPVLVLLLLMIRDKQAPLLTYLQYHRC